MKSSGISRINVMNITYNTLGAKYCDADVGRFLTIDRFADKYPSLTPYQYAANNPALFVDVNGDSIKISAEMLNNEALANYASTVAGYKYLAQFAYENETITINGRTFKFDKAGKYSKQNLKFTGITTADAGTTPVNSILGEGFVADKGVQGYEIKISNSIMLGVQMDDIFHEVQHASMFAGGSFRGKINQRIKDIQHGRMLLPKNWIQHERFINESNQKFNTGINPNEIFNQLYNQINDPNVAKIIIKLLKKYNKRK